MVLYHSNRKTGPKSMSGVLRKGAKFGQALEKGPMKRFTVTGGRDFCGVSCGSEIKAKKQERLGNQNSGQLDEAKEDPPTETPPSPRASDGESSADPLLLTSGFCGWANPFLLLTSVSLQ